MMNKPYSYDALDDELSGDEFKDIERNEHRQQVRKKLDDYLERKRLRKSLEDDEFDYFDD